MFCLTAEHSVLKSDCFLNDESETGHSTSLM
eukprot:COSAG02_NODE_7931_length_2780_cov_17.807907_3_plen_30_part_01